ncbi:MAG: molecular chaperone TorD family protein [Myxococcota bacterium]|nr:molecular chaperone TorD family protein [Myxococcota bacterium]
MPENRRSHAIARGRAYALLGDLFRHGPRRLDHLRAVDALAPHLPSACDDDAMAAHFGLFGQELPPYEGVFLDERALLGGPCSRAVRDAMTEGGFMPDESDAGPDHIGSELAFLAHLCGAEADAWRDGQDDAARHVQALQATFLWRHLLRWLPAQVVAIETVDSGLYAAAGRLSLALAVDHLDGPPSGDDLARVPEILEEAKTGMRQIADFLAVPLNTGALLTPASIRSLGRRAGVPAGFGKRGMLLENLLQTAIRNGCLPALLASLDGHLASQAAALQATVGGGPWMRRVGETRQMIARMVEAASAPAGR